MKFASMRYFLLMTIFILSGCFFQTKHESKIEFVNNQGVANPLIFKLLNLTDILYTDGTLSSIVDETQKHWLRKPGSERWDIENNPHVNQQEIYKICEKLQMFSEIKPEHVQYEHAFVLGGIFDRMKARFQFLIDQWNNGVRFNSIVLLGSSRAANKEQGENQQHLEKWANTKIDHMPSTETELLKFIYDHIPMPEDMRKVPLQIIDVPMLQNPDGTMKRPTTADTIEAWLGAHPKIGKVLAISSQPYVGYQNSVMQTLIPASFEVDTIGQACSHDQKIGLLLDTLARTLYQEKIRLQK